MATPIFVSAVINFLDPAAFALPVMLSHLAIDPVDHSSPPELASLLRPLRELRDAVLPQLNTWLTPQFLRTHFTLRRQALSERPHTAVTYMLHHADYSHALGNMLSAISAGRAVASTAGSVWVSHLVYWGGGVFAALDPFSLEQLQLERRIARVVSDLLGGTVGGGGGGGGAWQWRAQQPAEWAHNVESFAGQRWSDAADWIASHAATVASAAAAASAVAVASAAAVASAVSAASAAAAAAAPTDTAPRCTAIGAAAGPGVVLLPGVVPPPRCALGGGSRGGGVSSEGGVGSGGGGSRVARGASLPPITAAPAAALSAAAFSAAARAAR